MSAPDIPPRPRVVADAPPGAALRPRVIPDDGASPAPRLDFGWDKAVAPVAPPAGGGWSSLALLGAGAAVLVLGLSLLDAANFVAAQFARAPWLGWLTLAVATTGFALVFGAIWREARGYLALRGVDRARAALARGDLAALREEVAAWQRRLPPGRARLPDLPSLALDELRAMTEATCLAPIAADAAALGRAAALQAFAVTAVSPSPGLDALVFAWRGLRLVRQVAALHGLRPGLLGTVALLRRVAVDAATVAATDVAVDAVVRGLMTSRLAEHVAGEAAAGAVAARRMVLLARAADEACRILPRA